MLPIKTTTQDGIVPTSDAKFRMLKQDWEMLGSETLRGPNNQPTSKLQKAKEKVKSYGPAYRKFQSVVIGIAG